MKFLMMLPIFMFGVLVTSYSNAQVSAESPSIPTDIILRNQVEGMMIQQTDVILDAYHKEVQLIKFPNERLATGKEEAVEFWNKKFSEEQEVAYDLINSLESNNYYFTKIRRFDQQKGQESFLAIIYVIKDGKVTQVYFL